MAIAFDNKATLIFNTGGTSTSASFTTAGSNRLLIVGWAQDGSGSATSMSYGGTSMTSLTSVAVGTANIGLFYLINPASGSNTLSITRNISTNTLECAIISYTGVKQSGFPDASNSGNSAANPTTNSLTVVAGNSWIASIAYAAGGGTLSSGTNQTLREAMPDVNRGILDSNAAIAAGATSLSWNWSSAPSAGGYISFSFAPPTTVYTLTATSGSYALTGNATTLHKVMTLVAVAGSYALTGIAATLKYIQFPWQPQSKHTSSFAAESKNTSSFTAQSKTVASGWTPENKN